MLNDQTKISEAHNDKPLHQIIAERLENNCYGAKSIPVYGSAYHIAIKYGYNTNFDAIVDGINNAIQSAKFFTPDVKSKKVAYNYCHLFFIDPTLVEIYCGTRFN